MLIKQRLINATVGGEQFYNEISASAYDTFGTYQRVNANLAHNMERAREELKMAEKMNDVIRESRKADEFCLNGGRATVRIEN